MESEKTRQFTDKEYGLEAGALCIRFGLTDCAKRKIKKWMKENYKNVYGMWVAFGYPNKTNTEVHESIKAYLWENVLMK